MHQDKAVQWVSGNGTTLHGRLFGADKTASEKAVFTCLTRPFCLIPAPINPFTEDIDTNAIHTHFYKSEKIQAGSLIVSDFFVRKNRT